MKLNLEEISKRLIKTKENKVDVSLGSFGEEFFNIYVNHYDNQERLVGYWLGKWLCTDTPVGYIVYFFDDVLVAYSFKLYRKSDENLSWVSNDAYKKVRDYIMSFKDDDSFENIVDPKEEINVFYKIEYNSQLFTSHFKIPYYNGEKVEIVKINKGECFLEKNMISGLFKYVKIKHENGLCEWVEVSELDFPFNIEF